MARNKKVEILSNDKEVLHPMTDGDCVIFEDGQTLTQKLSEDDSVKYTPEIVNSSPMFKVGEGNTVDYSDNVLDGAYERATLQGQTYVNYIQESSADEVTLPTPFTEYERTQHNTLTSDEEGTLGINLVGQSYVNALQHDSEEEYVVLGENLEFQEKKVEYTNEGQIKSAMLKGQTLVNLNNGERNKTLNSTSGDGKLRTYSCSILYPIPSGTYITFKLKTNTTDGITGNLKAHFRQSANSTTDGDLYPTLRNYQTHPTGEYYVNVCYQTPIDIEALNIYIDDYVGVIDISDVMILIGDHTLEDIPYFEGMQSVTVSTKLENKLGTCTTTLSTNPKTGKTFTTNDGNTRSLYFANNSSQLGLKPNTKYIVGFKVSNLVLDGLSMVTLMLNVDSTNRLFEHPNGNGSTIYVDKNGVYRFVMKTTNTIESATALIKGIAEEWENSSSSLRSMTISEIMYVEYQNGMENWDLPYFEDYQVMKPVQVESVNKNLFDGKLIVGGLDNVTGLPNSTQTDRQYSANYIKVKPNTGYIFSTNYPHTIGIREFDKNYNFIKWYTLDINTNTLTTSSETHFIRFVIINTNTDNQIQLEESSTATSYVPHQSKTTYSWDEVVLRKVGDVEDTLDLTTGEWVQRIGEIVLDGSENWATNNESTTQTIRFILKDTPMDSGVLGQDYSTTINQYECDKLQKVAWNETTPLGITHTEHIIFIYNNSIENSAEGIKQWLKSNPIKIQYILETPIVHKVNLSRPNLQVYDDITHIHTKCLDGTLIPNIYLPSDISYPAILEPGKKYNVSINHTEVSTDNPLKVNVGGTEITMTDSRMTLTTPTTLANSNVSFTGKGNKIKESMLIKNSSLLTRDLPHFNGIGSVQLGKTIENLSSASGFKAGNSDATITWYDNYAHIKISNKAGSCVFVYELVKPLENGKKYFIYSPQTLGNDSCRTSFRQEYNNTLTYAKQQTLLPKNGKCIIEIDQQDNLYTHICVGCHHDIPLNTEFDMYRPIICEYKPGMEDWDWETIGYFTGTKNIGNEFMRVQNKNLFDGKLEYGAINGNTGIKNSSSQRMVIVNPIKIEKDKQYAINLTESNGIYMVREFLFYKDVTYNSYVGRLIPSQYSSNVNFTATEDGYMRFAILKRENSNSGVETTVIESEVKLQVEESSTATTYTAHKHNVLYITKDQPIDLAWEQGQVLVANFGDTYTSAINNTLSTRIRTKGLFNLKPNTTYRVSLGNKTGYKYHIACFDNQDFAEHAITGIATGWVSSFDTIFTTTKDMHKIGINVAKIGDTNITPGNSVHAQVRLEEVTDVVLRSCSGKYDELDLTRGTYTQNVGVVYADGVNQHSNYITVVGDTYQPTDTTLKTFDIRCDGAVVDSICLSNRFPMRESMTSTDINFESVRIHSTNSSCRLTIKKEKASTLEEFKLWLQDNPLEIVYALSKPIVHKVHIGNKNETNTEVTKPNDVFTLPTLYTEQTHIDLINNGIMPKVQSRDYIAYPVSPMVSRTYTLQHNLTGGVSNLTVDLLGRTQEITYQEPKALIYSPGTMDAILHHELRISGKGKVSRVMYIDGGYMDRDIPYIEGMKNAVNPIVKNIGKNLISQDNINSSNINLTNGRLTYDASTFSFTGGTQYNDMQFYVYLVKNRQYTLRCEGIFYNVISLLKGYQGSYNEYLEIQKIDNSSIFTYVGETGWTTVHIAAIQSLYNLQLVENRVLNKQAEPYEENICYVDCGEIRLTPDMFEQGSIYSVQAHIGLHYNDDKVDGSARIRTKELIDLEPGEQYVFIGDPTYLYSMHFYDKNGIKVGVASPYDLSWKGNVPFTIRTDAPKAAIFICKANQTNIIPSELEKINFQLVKVSEIKQMRSLPHGVQDEIDLETGKYIQRVGEITFNGTESWIVGYASWDNKRTYYNNHFVDIKTNKGDNGSGQAYYDAVRCPQLHRSYMSRLASALIDGICSYYYGGYQRIFISKQDCATVEELKLWLQENPVTVQYELPEPIVKDIVIHNYPHSYEGGHVIIENGDLNTPIPAQLTYRAVTNRSGQIQQHTEQVEKQEREINELETLILANIHLNQTR